MGAVLVTGGAGYVGSHACKALAQAGETPVTYDDLSTGFLSSVKWGALVPGRIHDTDGVLRAIQTHKVDAVMHFAGSSCVAESVQAPAKYFHNNVIGSLQLLDAVRVAGVKHFVFSSSAAVYGDGGCDGNQEGCPMPMSAYGESKEFVELVLHRYRVAYGLRSVSLRYFNAAGADLDGETGERHDPETHLIPLAIEAALTGGAFQIFGADYETPDGTAIRDYVHVTDLADAHVKALKYLRKGGDCQTLNLGAGGGLSVRQVIHAVEIETGKRVYAEIAPRRRGDPARLIASIDEAERVLGWSASEYSTLRTIVRTALAWRQRK